jgi:hypothetical protein
MGRECRPVNLGEYAQVSAGRRYFVRSAGVVIAAVALAFLPGVAIAKAKAKPEFTKTEEILKWINDYRHEPEPERLPDAVKAMFKLGLLKDVEQAGIYVGFIAGVVGANSDKAEKLLGEMFPMPPPDQIVVVKAIAYSGLPEWKDLMGKFVERMPARRVVIERFLFGKMPTLRALPLDNPMAVDALWGYYFATGSSEPIQRLIVGLAWAQNKDDVDKLTTGSMIKWTLAQNASRDHDLLQYLKASLQHQPEKVAEPLGEVIEASETFEMTQLRRDALASIEELKLKGPQSSRNFAWWGQVGQTTFALGCVAAGVMGQVYAGIPCVVGGALSNVALKYLAPAK